MVEPLEDSIYQKVILAISESAEYCSSYFPPLRA